MEKTPKSQPTMREKPESQSPYKSLADAPGMAEIEKQLEWYRLIHLGRLLDNKARIYLRQAKGWSYHASHAGHDGIQVALGLAFRPNKDFLFPYYRDMLTCLAAGLTPHEIILNGLTKANDLAGGGRHMSNHFSKISVGIWNVSSATGSQAQQAAGLARAIKYYDADSIVFCSQGESSCSEGFVFEALNGASREQLPVIFVIQNNGYGISVPVREQTANPIVSENFRGLRGLTIINCDGTNPFDAASAMRRAVEHVHAYGGPLLVHAFCERLQGHSNSDRHELYRSEEDLMEMRLYDPYERLRLHLLNVENVEEVMLLAIEEENEATVEDAAERAEAAPDPDPKTAMLYVIPCESEVSPEATIPQGGSPITLREAINETLKYEFQRNPNTFLWGQDVASRDKGGVFNVTKGMQQAFGPSRVFNAPVAEDYIVGTANGFSRFREDIWVVIEAAQFADYLWPAMEQVVEASHEYYRSNGQFVPNIVARLASGGYIGGGLYHSQNLEAVLSTLPGLRIVIPAYADDAVGLLRHAMRSRGITFVLEPKYLYNQVFAKAPNPGDHYEIPFGRARVRRKGNDLTMVSYGTTVHWCVRAAYQLKERHGIEAEVIDLRSLVPLDVETVLASVRKTSKALVVHEDKMFSGFGGEIVAQIIERCFWSLDAPILRIGSEYCPVPFSRLLEREVLPHVEDVYEKALMLMERRPESVQVPSAKRSVEKASPPVGDKDLTEIIALYEARRREAQSKVGVGESEKFLAEAWVNRQLMSVLMDENWFGLGLLAQLKSSTSLGARSLASAVGSSVDEVAATLARLVGLGALEVHSGLFTCADRGIEVLHNLEKSVGLSLDSQ